MEWTVKVLAKEFSVNILALLKKKEVLLMVIGIMKYVFLRFFPLYVPFKVSTRLIKDL